MTKRPVQERRDEYAAHPGQVKYKIFYKEGGRRVTVREFWAKSDDEAAECLSVFRMEEALVGDGGREYFYGPAGRFTVMLPGCMCEEYDDMAEMAKAADRTSPVFARLAGRSAAAWRSCRAAWRRAAKMAADLWFWLRHYDFSTGTSVQRLEGRRAMSAFARSAELVMLDALRASRSGESVPGWRWRPHCPEESRAEWERELESGVAAARRFMYFDALTSPSVRFLSERDYAEIDRSPIAPYKPGTDGEVDYGRCLDGWKSAWRDLWAWWGEHGGLAQSYIPEQGK